MTLHELRPHLLPVLILVLALVFLDQVAGLAHTAWRTSALERAAAEIRTLPAPAPTPPAEADASRDARLSERGLFRAPRKAGPPPSTDLKCTAVLGDAALINNQWLRAGDHVADATIVEILPGSVVVEKNGDKQTLSVFPQVKVGP